MGASRRRFRIRTAAEEQAAARAPVPRKGRAGAVAVMVALFLAAAAAGVWAFLEGREMGKAEAEYQDGSQERLREAERGAADALDRRTQGR